MPALKLIDLTFWGVRDAGWAALSNRLGERPQMQVLNLEGDMGDVGFTALAAAVGKMPNLRTIFLEFGSVGDAGWDHRRHQRGCNDCKGRRD